MFLSVFKRYSVGEDVKLLVQYICHVLYVFLREDKEGNRFFYKKTLIKEFIKIRI